MTPASRSLALLAAAQADIRTFLTEPVMAWITSPKPKRTDARYRDLLLIPIDLAAAGWLVQINKRGDEWQLLLAKPVSTDKSIDVSAHANSFVHALYRIGLSANGHITSLESTFRVQDRSLATRAHERVMS